MRLTITNLFILLKVFWHRFQHNKLSQAAGYLTYSTMLAIVPLIMVVFAFFSAFPVFQDLTVDFKHFIFENFAPSVSDVVGQYVDLFIENTRKMSAIGIIGLIIVALMLIKSIDTTLNMLWSGSKPRSIFYSFAIYWMILTLGPLFIAASIAISSYIFSNTIFQQENLPFGFKLLSFVPFFITWFAFTCIYAIVPNTKVNLVYAATGALIAATFFTIGKSAFSWYMTSFPSYQLIYGALATLPIMIVWIHLSWTFVLLGAQLTAVLEDMRKIKQGELDLGMNLKSHYDKMLEQKSQKRSKKEKAKYDEADTEANEL